MNLLRSASSRAVLLALAAGGMLGAANLAKAESHVGIGLSVGIPLPHGYAEVNVGRDHYYYHRGVFYRPGPHGYYVVRAPRGGIVHELPPYYSRVYIGGSVYYRYGDVYYQTAPGGYVVVDPPSTVVVSSPTPTTQPPAAGPEKGEDYQSVWVGDTEYQFKDGQFFKRTPEGMVWSPAPTGAITKSLPNDARSVWYQDIEYFESDDVYFRKTPDGYRVVEAPWKK